MKKLFPLLLVFIMAFSVACGNSDKSSNEKTEDIESTEPKEISIGRPYDITTLDSSEANDDGSYMILYHIAEGLVRNDGGEIMPGVAKDWDISDDGIEYTFYLREDASWSDGSPLTAEDFKYTYLRLLDPEVGHYHANSSFIFKNGEAYFNGEADIEEVGIEVIDEHTIKFILEKPSIEALYTLTGYDYTPVNKKMVEEYDIEYGSEAEKVLTNGPFNLTNWSHEDKIIMEKNEKYWNKDAVKLDKITAVVGASGETAVDMLSAGELDFIESSDVDRIAELESEGFVSEKYTSGYQSVQINSNGKTEETGRFMGNSNFRRALNLAVNREAIVNSVYKGAIPTTRLSSIGDIGVDTYFHEEYPYEAWSASGDVEKAKEYLDLALEELDATIEDVPELTMLCFESENALMVLQAVQDMFLTNLGINTTIDPQPIQQMISKAVGGEWDFWWGGNTVGTMDWASPGSLGASYYSRYGTNVNNYNNDEYNKKFEEVENALNLKERKDKLFELEQIICEDPGGIVIGWNQGHIVMVPELTDFVSQIGNWNITYMDIK